MSFWASGFWADDFWADGFWATTVAGTCDPAEIAAAVWNKQVAPGMTALQALQLVVALLRNKTVTDGTTGRMTVYDTDDETPLLEADLFEDAAGTQPYRSSGIERRERLT